MSLHPIVEAVTARIVERSAESRARYLELVAREADKGLRREVLGCSNLAHGFAAALEDSAAFYEEHGRGIRLLRVAGGWRFATDPSLATSPNPESWKRRKRRV